MLSYVYDLETFLDESAEFTVLAVSTLFNASYVLVVIFPFASEEVRTFPFRSYVIFPEL